MAGNPQGDVVDLLEYEDQVLRTLFERLSASERRLEHGILAKLVVRHLALRETAKELVTDALEHCEPSDLADELRPNTMKRRELLARLDEMIRGLRPVDVNQGQDFDEALEPLQRMVEYEIRDEIDRIVPDLQKRFPATSRRKQFKSAKYAVHHSPTHPNPHKIHFYERIGPVARIHAVYDSLREYPTYKKRAKIDIEQANKIAPS